MALGGDHREAAESQGLGQAGADGELSRSGADIGDEASERITCDWQLSLACQSMVHKGHGMP